MAALVDQHRLLQPLDNKRTQHLLDHCFPVVALQSIKVDLDGIVYDGDFLESGSSTEHVAPSGIVNQADNAQPPCDNEIPIQSEDEDDDLPLTAFVHSKLEVTKPVTDTCESIAPVVSIPLCHCTKPAIIDDPRWDGQYCSTECVIHMCHEAFAIWIESHQNTTIPT